MAKLGWSDIRNRALKFSKDWENESSETAEAHTFWDEFFKVFGLERRAVASFEEPVKTLKGTYGFIDLFWKGKLLAEHKTRGKPLDRAQAQAFDYIQALQREGREDEVPRYVMLSDFARIVVYDLEPEEGDDSMFEVALADFPKQVRRFDFIIGQKTHKFRDEDPANLDAAKIMADLHDAVEESGYTGQPLERLLVRILFCLFADDTGIFEGPLFQTFIESETEPDGRNMGAQLLALFEVLNTPDDKRGKHLDDHLRDFPYVNGDLFAERLPLPSFNRAMRDRLVAATRFDWSKISPAIFGSLFQGIMDDMERRQIGAHYTSERDILKVIGPLFLDDLRAELDQIKADRSTRRVKRALDFQAKLASLTMLDPACGCGNFLVIAYRELRRLELEALQLLPEAEKGLMELDQIGEEYKRSRVDVHQFYGIEIGEWPARIAETALWLTDHQMNVELSNAFGNRFQRIPLKAAPHIKCANALRMDWNELLPAKDCSYVFGNPPFVGHHFQDDDQKDDQQLVLAEISSRGVLDYVCNWYVKAAEYCKESSICCAFVSTNSISQGEQAAILWTYLFGKFGLKIHFAHRTFAWKSEARGPAHVHVVIIGFGPMNRERKLIYDYEDLRSDPDSRQVSNISPYLVEGPDLAVPNRSTPICDVPSMRWGNKPTDGGNFLFSEEEKLDLLRKDPAANAYLRRYVSGQDMLNDQIRYCLWLADVSPGELRQHPEILKRVEAVREFRLASTAESTRRFADHPTLFRQIAQPDSDYLAIPEVSSEKRAYIPMAYLPKDVICSNTVQFVPDASVYHFGVLTSTMHMAWMRQICGRLESRYRYSNSLVYNNFPWPVNATEAQKAKVEACAQGVLDARQPHLDGGATLADLYDPLTMPKDLLDAHHALDRAVDKCYRGEKFTSERERVEFLFKLYEELTAPLVPAETPKKKRAKKAT